MVDFNNDGGEILDLFSVDYHLDQSVMHLREKKMMLGIMERDKVNGVEAMNTTFVTCPQCHAPYEKNSIAYDAMMSADFTSNLGGCWQCSELIRLRAEKLKQKKKDQLKDDELY